MAADSVLIAGLFLAALSAPSILMAALEGRAPRMGAVLVTVATLMITWAYANKPLGYRWEELPQVFARVVGNLWS